MLKKPKKRDLFRCKDDSTYTGGNIENHGIQSICREQVAFTKALSEGKRDFVSMAIVGAPKGTEPSKMCLPCGYCRQFISEFVDNDFKFIVEDKDRIVTYNIDELLPKRFQL